MSKDTRIDAARAEQGRERKPRHRVAARAAEQATETTTDAISFADLGLPVELVNALSRQGITTPFPIQAATMPDALAGKDVLGRGQTGSGKTLAFGLPMLTRLAGGRTQAYRPRALVLVPTRELAMQVEDSLAPFAAALNLSCATVVGGTSFPKQINALRRGVDLLIATPGRLADHVRQGTAELGDVTIAALDEADQMADMGFLPQVRELLDLVAPDGQRLLFSATLDGDVDKLVREYLKNPVTHSTAPPSASVTTMEHHVLLVSAADKAAIVAEVGAREGRTIMFVRTKHTVDRLAERLRSVGVRAGALHGGKTQGARTRTLDDFRDGISPVLVATDVAARGIHVDGVSLVLHVDPPADPKDYLHRAGRTARAGESGTVVTLMTHNQRRSVRAMTGKAGVNPVTTKVAPGDPALVAVTGAREPSGIPVPEEPVRSRGGGRRRGSEGERAEYRRGDHSGGRNSRERWGDRGQGGRPQRYKPSADERGGMSRRDFTDTRRDYRNNGHGAQDSWRRDDSPREARRDRDFRRPGEHRGRTEGGFRENRFGRDRNRDGWGGGRYRDESRGNYRDRDDRRSESRGGDRYRDNGFRQEGGFRHSGGERRRSEGQWRNSGGRQGGASDRGGFQSRRSSGNFARRSNG